MEPEMIKEYFHEDLNQEVQAIGGRYVLTDEKQLRYNDQEILYLTGHAVFDSTCCGSGGCVYAVVYGIIVNWKRTGTKVGLQVEIPEGATATVHVPGQKQPVLAKAGSHTFEGSL